MVEKLLSSGLSIKEALETVNKSRKGFDFNPAALILDQIKKGKSFSAACQSINNYFPQLFIQLIETGENTGKLNDVFSQLSRVLDFKLTLKKKLLSAMIYPAIVIATSILSITAMIFFIFPKLKEMFANFSENAAEKISENINLLENFFSVFILALLLIFTGLYIVKAMSRKNLMLKIFLDRFLLKIPFAGKVILNYLIMNFSFVMETLTAGGLGVKESLNKAENTCKNQYFLMEIKRIEGDLTKGIRLSDSIEESKILPFNMQSWIISGEKSGSITNSFLRLKVYYEKELESLLEKIISFMEPALTLLTGSFLLIIILTIIVPVFSLYGNIL